MQSISSTFALLMPKVNITPIKQKTKQEEVKEIIQAPNDPLSKFPVRAFGYSNEVGAALSAMPVWGKAAEVGLWIPALLYLGADIYDKYSRGKEGNYTKASSQAAVQQAIFQALASVILPTAAVKMGQGLAGYTAKFDGSGLTASAKEEMYDRLLDEFDNYNFAKGDIVENGKTIKGIDRVKNRIITQKLKPALVSTRSDLKTESIFAKIVRFFAHSNRPIASAKSDINKVIKFVEKEAEEIFNTQTLLENAIREDIVAQNNSKMLKHYDIAMKNVDERVQDILKHKPELIIKKILNSQNPKYSNLKATISQVYDSVEKKRLLVREEQASRKMLDKLMETPENSKLINDFVKKIEIARYTLRKQIKSKSMKLGLLKTAGGFIALGCLAVPIDHFVHNYIIKKFIEPSLDTVKNYNQKKAERRASIK